MYVISNDLCFNSKLRAYIKTNLLVRKSCEGEKFRTVPFEDTNKS